MGFFEAWVGSKGEGMKTEEARLRRNFFERGAGFVFFSPQTYLLARC